MAEKSILIKMSEAFYEASMHGPDAQIKVKAGSLKWLTKQFSHLQMYARPCSDFSVLKFKGIEVEEDRSLEYDGVAITAERSITTEVHRSVVHGSI